jgi:hypothetical protein
MKRGPLVLAAVLLAIVLGTSAYVMRVRNGDATIVVPLAQDASPRAPAGARVRVQVVNTTKTRGLARRATRLLRDRGFDVVELGTGGPLRDTTLVLDRSGHPAWASAVAKVLGQGARAEARPDTSRYLDVTVLLGGSWRPPALPLYP